MEVLKEVLQNPEVLGIIVAIVVYIGKTVWQKFDSVRNSKASALARKVFWELEDGKSEYKGGESKEEAFDYLFEKGWEKLTGRKPSDDLKTTAFETVQEINTNIKTKK